MADASFYDVFISHRGTDSKNNFAAALYNSLSFHGLRVFFDKREMKAGKHIMSQLKDAIQVSSVHVAILTEGYAQSTWCLEELDLMVESVNSGKAILLPVFHDVKPSDLRWTGKDKSGVYAAALCVHEEKGRVEIEKIQKWRESLFQVANISGFELAAFNGNAFVLLQNVVQRVVKIVPKPQLPVAKHAIGLPEKLNEFESIVLTAQQQDAQAKVVGILGQDAQAKVVGILGSGGIGKTTVVKQFFNNTSSIYDKSCILFEVASTSLEKLQSNLLMDLTGIEFKIRSFHEGIGYLEKFVSNCKALLVLDDIDHANQLNALLLPIKKVLHRDSLLLLTSRDKRVLSAEIEESFIYPLKGLSREHSQALFSLHAFSEPQPPPEFENIVDRFVTTCHGSPLSLIVLGGSVRGRKDKSQWQEVLNGLPQTLPEDIVKSLRVSYDSLDVEEKKIFLDVACFCMGEQLDKWVQIWYGSGWKGSVDFKTLQDKCLVEVDTGNVIRMHDHLRIMGRNIALEKPLPIRRWCGTSRNVFELLEQSVDVPAEVRGIRMAPSSTLTDTDAEGSFRLELEKLLNSDEVRRTKISKLQLLEGEGDFVESMLKVKVRASNLLSLRWNDCPCSCLPSFSMHDLRVLEVDGRKLERLWESDSQVPRQLRHLKIDAPLIEFPESLGKLQHLEKIVVKSPRLTTMPDSLGDLTNLQHINLSMCKSLSVLPDSMEKLKNLRFLGLDSCKNLEKLPDYLLNLLDFQEYNNIPAIKNLKCLPPINKDSTLPILYYDHDRQSHLNLSGFPGLKMIPNSIRDMKRLYLVNLKGCERLEMLPDFWGNFTRLEYIYLEMCKSLKRLPESLGNVESLYKIDLSGCESLQMLPESFGNLTSLYEIDLSGCESLQMLPESFGNLTSLRVIKLNGCKSLKKLPNSLGSSLRHLHLKDCCSLTISTETLENVTGLYCLDLSGYLQMDLLPPIVGRQLFLKKLNLLDTNLKELPGDDVCLRNLQVLRLGSPLLEVLPTSLGCLTELQELWLHGCEKLQILPDSIELLTWLRELNIRKCGIQYLPPAVMKLNRLRKLAVHRCPLRELPFRKFEGEKGMVQLEVLQLNGTEISEVSFAEGVCPNLRDLSITFCNDLVEVEALPTTLVSLDLKGCRALMRIGGLCGLENLRTLDTRGCDNIQESLPKLQTLISSGCGLLNTPLDTSDGQGDCLLRVFCHGYW